MYQLIELYKRWRGYEPTCTQQLPGAGSNRVYYRLTDADGQSVVGCIGTSRDENHAFVYLAQHFTKCQLPVPKVLAVSDDELRYLQTDLGSVSLFDAIRAGREAGGCYTQEEQELLKRTIRQLPNIQFRGARDLDFSNCYPQSEFDVEGVFFDLNYFKYCFLKATELDFHELKLEADFRLLAKDLTAEQSDSFLYRDFQARNVMLSRGDTPCFIDFQGGRRGPFYYDLASFLWQASAKYSDRLRRELLDDYYEAAQQLVEMPKREHFDRRLSLFVLFRTLQVLGAYGFRGYFEQKKHFIDSIPPAIQNLRELLATVHSVGQESFDRRYPYLYGVLRRLTELPRFRHNDVVPQGSADGCKTTDVNPGQSRLKDGPASFSKYDAQGPLVVKVFSFSYRKGIPEDESGNGGGYVFDCRSTHNPGRYEPYKQLTGLDEPVIRFLEDNGEILTFLDSVYRLADAHVSRYIQRGFTSLMFCFGCTGGQHRSVYSAQHLGEHIHQKFGIEVHICHWEQGIVQVLKNV
ncbi:MAG: phosphotransferase [Prevotella sp.]|nr:phosphotransferase [Prevotella sp.]